MKFSIIVPIYGVEPYIKQCLDSILSQTYGDFEAILVDDGSIDGCAAICDDYAARDSRFIVIHKENGGLVSSRQAGVEIASGEYIICIDGDDWVSPYYLEHFASIIDIYEPDIIVSGSIYAYPDKNENKPSILRKGYYNLEDLKSEIFPYLIYSEIGKKQFQAQLWAKTFKKSVYQQQQQLINKVVNMGEDRACVIPTVYHSFSMYVLDGCHYYYRQHQTSMTKLKKPLRTDGPKLIYEHLLEHLDVDKFGFLSQIYKGTCHSLFNVCKSQFCSNEGYFIICNRIKKILNDDVYQTCINNAKFNTSFAHKIMHLSLKYKFYFLIFLYSRIR